jgi:hypothetical protein
LSISCVPYSDLAYYSVHRKNLPGTFELLQNLNFGFLGEKPPSPPRSTVSGLLLPIFPETVSLLACILYFSFSVSVTLGYIFTKIKVFGNMGGRDSLGNAAGMLQWRFPGFFLMLFPEFLGCRMVRLRPKSPLVFPPHKSRAPVIKEKPTWDLQTASEPEFCFFGGKRPPRSTVSGLLLPIFPETVSLLACILYFSIQTWGRFFLGGGGTCLVTRIEFGSMALMIKSCQKNNSGSKYLFYFFKETFRQVPVDYKTFQPVQQFSFYGCFTDLL